jgi:cell division protein FtsZ
MINLDFADVKAVMKDAGPAWMSIGRGSGKNRAVDAAREALASPLLDVTIEGSKGVLFNVVGGSDLTLFEVNQAAAIIKETAHPDVNLIFGAVIDPNLTDEVHITVIATGFDRAGVRPGTVERPARLEDSQASVRARPAVSSTTERPAASGSTYSSSTRTTSSQSGAAHNTGSTSQPQQNDFQRVMNTDDLDIPAFMRNRNNRS